MKIKPIKQRDDSACGPTSIQMALAYFGIPTTFNEIAKISQYKKKDGLTNSDLVESFKRFGLNVVEKKEAAWKDLKSKNTPKNIVVVSWMMDGYIGHFSLVEEIGKDYIKLADPHTGKITKMQKVIFMRLWMDYDDMWFPLRNTDIQLRWMCVVSKGQ